MRSPLEMLVLGRTLNHIRAAGNTAIIDYMIERHPDQVEQSAQLKNVCAKVTTFLADDIDQVCDLLAISKREFIESALIEAVTKAKAIMQEEGFFEAHQEGGE